MGSGRGASRRVRSSQGGEPFPVGAKVDFKWVSGRRGIDGAALHIVGKRECFIQGRLSPTPGVEGKTLETYMVVMKSDTDPKFDHRTTAYEDELTLIEPPTVADRLRDELPVLEPVTF